MRAREAIALIRNAKQNGNERIHLPCRSAVPAGAGDFGRDIRPRESGSNPGVERFGRDLLRSAALHGSRSNGAAVGGGGGGGIGRRASAVGHGAARSGRYLPRAGTIRQGRAPLLSRAGDSREGFGSEPRVRGRHAGRSGRDGERAGPLRSGRGALCPSRPNSPGRFWNGRSESGADAGRLCGGAAKGELRSPTSTKRVDVTRGRHGGRGDAAILLRRSDRRRAILARRRTTTDIRWPASHSSTGTPMCRALARAAAIHTPSVPGLRASS